MTFQEGLSNLKPFVFMIHPDFFQQHPHAKQVNENSLKLLHNYLQLLENNENNSSCDVLLKFYIRDKKADGSYKSELSIIQLKLNEKSISDIVSSILKFCSNPRPLHTNPKIRSRSDAPKTYYDINFMQRYTNVNKSPPIQIVKWLKENITLSREIREQSAVLLTKIDELKLQIMRNFQLRDIVWNSNMSSHKYLASLYSLERVVAHISPLKFPGKIIFTSEENSGINCYGDMLLSCSQVPQVWMKHLQCLDLYSGTLEAIEVIEKEISRILNNSEICLIEEFHTFSLATDYKRVLSKFIFTLSLLRSDKYRRLRSRNKYTLTDLVMTPFIHNTGAIVLPADVESNTLLLFLENDHEEAKKFTKTVHDNNHLLFKKLEMVFVSEFKCKKVSLKVSLEVGLRTLKKVLDLLRCQGQVIDFDSSSLIIDSYYGTTSSGDIIIPWNFDQI